MVKTKDAVNDMTVGTPAKLIIQFMIPVFLGNIFQQFYNIADSIVAGQFIGVKALAAIGSTGSGNRCYGRCQQRKYFLCQ